ncbi:MAG TPA: CpsD/CapB family tyrosine-protein kinase [Dongiaceae bacterium]|nr:CpsD/CapB family tyrosine-protein kinase [Dongiaceae bacterium]
MASQILGQGSELDLLYRPKEHATMRLADGTEAESIKNPIRYTRTAVFQPDPNLLRKNRILTQVSEQKVVHAYKLLRTQVLQKLKANGWNSLAVMSCRSSQGATITAINLAISIALDPRFTVLLVDMNLRNPSIHRYFGIEPSVGISDVAASQVPLEDVLLNPGLDGMLILPGIERVAESSEMLNSERMIALVNEIRAKYPTRIVVFDLPGILDAEDAVAFLPYFDAGLLVLSEGKTRNDDLERAMELICDKPVLGSILNDAPA